VHLSKGIEGVPAERYRTLIPVFRCEAVPITDYETALIEIDVSPL